MCKRFSKHARTFLSLFLALVMTLSLAVVPSAAAKAAISKKSVSLVKGQSVTLSVTGTNGKVSWSSEDSSIASVSKSGKVTGKSLGTTTISAKVGKSTLKCKVTVTSGSIKINKNSVSVDVKKSVLVNLNVVGNIELAVSSSDKSVATALLKKRSNNTSYYLTIKGVSDGDARIKVYAKGYGKSIYKYINVKVGKGKEAEPVTSSGITVSVDSITINENTSTTVNIASSDVKLKDLSIISTATHYFKLDTAIDEKNNKALVRVTGLTEGTGNLRIYDPKSKGIDVFIPVTVTNNAYDVVVWNREPKRQKLTDVIYYLPDENNSKNYYILEPSDHDVAHSNTLLADASGIFVDYCVYEERPHGVDYLEKREKYKGKTVDRYVVIPTSLYHDEAYSNSAFGEYFGIYEYYTVYSTLPTARNYGDITIKYDYTTPGGKKEKRYILTQGKNFSFMADDAMMEYIQKTKNLRM